MTFDFISAGRTYAVEWHGGQKRKYTGEPYWRHCEEVASLVEPYLDPEPVAAAWLHDSIEDCGKSPEDVESIFGPRVRRLVVALTDVPYIKGGPNRAARKEMTRMRLLCLNGQDSIDAHTIKAADCLSNAPSIRDHDPDFWRVFRREVADLARVLTLAHPILLDRLCDELGVERLDHSRQTVWAVG